ncbi:hypothetical protein L6452_20274 [Arctium lappa]|uniref:Uncharacterized protein n=1 Tax=Arctium lappa TaxID=4217 RepID=A0ACB9BA62_ARCLA|nr:hypothetical protein L6452_20274 [Arctium lappa]
MRGVQATEHVDLNETGSVQAAEQGDIPKAVDEIGVGYIPKEVDETLSGEHTSQVDVEPRQDFDPFDDFDPFCGEPTRGNETLLEDEMDAYMTNFNSVVDWNVEWLRQTEDIVDEDN